MESGATELCLLSAYRRKRPSRAERVPLIEGGADAAALAHE
jgi:hypothetical protein